jgi:hypothetical protein
MLIILGITGTAKVERVPVARPSAASILNRLGSLRNRGPAHWAYLQISGRRVDDDQIAAVLRRGHA